MNRLAVDFEVPAVTDWRFRHDPRRIEFISERLEVEFAHTTYLMTRWPSWRLTYRSQDGAERAVTSAIAQSAILSCLEHVRTRPSKPADRLATYELLRDLPTPTHARLVRMGARYWHGVQFLAACPGAASLLESSPALFAAADALWAAGRTDIASLSELETLCRGRQRRLAARLGFNASECVCKVLRKFESYDLSAENWRRLIKNIACPEVLRPLQHAPLVPVLALEILSADDPGDVLPAGVMAEFVIAALQGGFLYLPINLPQLCSIGATLKCHGLLKTRPKSAKELSWLITRGKAMLSDRPFPAGPTVNLPGLSPIITPRDLQTEGTEMQHCVGNWAYVTGALKGEYCFYRMLFPERATIALRRERAWCPWKFEQVRGVRNTKLKPETLDQISKVLRAAAIHAPSPANN